MGHSSVGIAAEMPLPFHSLYSKKKVFLNLKGILMLLPAPTCDLAPYLSSLCWQSRPLLCAAALPAGVFDSEAHLGFVAFQVLQLLGIEGSVTFPSVKVAAVVLIASENTIKPLTFVNTFTDFKPTA